MARSNRIEIVEVGPRDGLQNETTILTTAQKLTLVDHLIAAGARRIEVASFANPRLVPQMADAEAVMAGVPRLDDVSYIGLVMNERGWQRALASNVDEVNIPVFATETFNRRNQGSGTLESIAMLKDVVADAKDNGKPVTGTISVAWGCPFEGEVPVERVLEVAEAMLDCGVTELALGDTIGAADPWSAADRIGKVFEMAGDVELRVHFHDTRNMGIANTFAAIQSGVRVVDASVGGMGGCPFAPAATGNIATDDLVFMLDRAGFDHGFSLSDLMGVSGEMEVVLGHEMPAMLPRAGTFPRGAA